MASGEGCEETAMVEQDQRDAAAILSMIEGEFRRAIEAEREFLDWRREHPDASFGEQLHRFAEYIHASEPYARSYRRISGTFPERMNEVHELLLPIQGEMSARHQDPGGFQTHAKQPRGGR
jgi:hypothetical protein